MNPSGYIDLQINGYVGVDFNKRDLTLSETLQACQALKRDGVSHVLATIITDSIPAMESRLAKLVHYRQEEPLIAGTIYGFHIEGPFISPVPGYVGAHPRDQARRADWDEMATLLDAAGGLTHLVTLAPEQDPQQLLTRRLVQMGITVAAGHTNATLDELNAAIDAGLSLFTHLGNGCPMLMDRHDNIIQRALSRNDALHYSFIADGAHIPFFALKNYLQLAGFDRSIIVSDAIAAAGCGPGRYYIGEQYVDVGADGIPRALDHSHLVGSGTTMQQMADNLQRELGLSAATIDQLMRKNPWKMLHSSIVGSSTPQPDLQTIKVYN